MQHVYRSAAALLFILLATLASGCRMRSLPKDVFLDKCRGAWAGQMIGVCYGQPYEFKFNGRPITQSLEPWTADRIANAVNQDDCYVEMTFLSTLEDYGLDVTMAQAGRAFAKSKYPLWHANLYGRENLRRGIMPPQSGHPKFNRHADDIDFQIEADLFGILSPGLPRESNRLCDVFGHVMNYGDGVYGGMFVAGMYAAAYFEDRDVGKVVRAGLACIPEKSRYHQCITDVIRWHREHPDDWLAVWHKIEQKWQDDVDCLPGDSINIDARLNGAYIAMGLLYGDGDPIRTAEIATRCGQDADCNPSNALGVLGCMKGYAALGPHLTGGMDSIADKKFSYTKYSFNSLIPACQAMAERIIRRAGGRITADAYLIPRQAPKPPATLEQWEDQTVLLSVAVPQAMVDLWDPTWHIDACGHYMEPGLMSHHAGRDDVLMVHPISRTQPASFSGDLDIPPGNRRQSDQRSRLDIEVASHPQGDFLLRVFMGNEHALEKLIDTSGQWTTVSIDISAHAGSTVTVRVEVHANDWKYEAAYFDKIAVN